MNPLLSGFLRVLLFAVGAAATALPRRFELWAGPRLGRLLLSVDGRRRRIAYDNIRRCLPELGEKGWRDLLERNYEHYGILVFELMHLFSPMRGHYRRYALSIMRLHGFENWKSAHDRGKGVLFASSHLGNWEMIAAAGNSMSLTMVTRRNKPEWFRKKLESARAELNIREAYDPRTLPIILKALRKGESVGFVVDQYAPPPAGVAVKFFGAPVHTLSALGPLAQRTGAAILPVSSYRDGVGLIHVVIEPELRLDPAVKEDPAASTQILASKVEEWIRQRPEQWLWLHRRFKNVEWAAEAAYQASAKNG